MDGFIMLPRSFYSHPIMKDGNALRCFIKILYKARFRDGEINTMEGPVDVDVGECVITIRWLASETGMSKGETEQALIKLKKFGFIEMKPKKRYTAIDVCREFLPNLCGQSPDKVQTLQNQEMQGIGGDNQTKSRQSPDTKKKKENNNINNNIYIKRAFEKFWEKYPNRFNKAQTEKNFIKTAKEYGADTVLRALDNYIGEIERTRPAKQYITKSTNFVGQKAVFLGYCEPVEDAAHRDRVQHEDDDFYLYSGEVPTAAETKIKLEKMRRGEL